MNLFSILGLLLGTICLTGFATLIYCAKRAPDGYEDVDGFRAEAEPALSRLPRPTDDFVVNAKPATRLAETA